MREVEISREGRHVCTARLADGFITRGVGLLGRKSLDPDQGLLIQPCTSVHTFFMRFPIDVLYLGKEGEVIRAVTMPAWRMSFGGRGAKSVLELASGTIDEHGIARGDRLKIVATEPEEAVSR
jgi:uncharacterized membrane protein (UPF0127 family)